MSIFSTLVTGTTGLEAQSNKIGAISTNIANVNTVGYKAAVASFAELLDSKTASGYVPGGVTGDDTQANDIQGNLISTDSPTDLAISGAGFFAVKASASSTGQLLFTRAGSFTPDANGNLMNGAGFYLQGWPLDANGLLSSGLSASTVDAGTATSSLQNVNIAQSTETPIPTSAVSLQANLDATILPYSSFDVAIKANLSSAQTAYAGPPSYDAQSATANMASGTVTPQFTAPITVTDSKGVSHTLQAGFLKTSADHWAVEVYGASSDIGNTGGQIASGMLAFNSDGSLATISPSLTQPLEVDWIDNAAATTLNINWGTAGPIPTGKTDGISQLNAASALASVQLQSYSAALPADNMASGAVNPSFSTILTVIDSTGVSHNLNAAFLKTATNAWAVELYAQPASDVAGAVNGQLASGTATFNGDGSLATISPALTQPLAITWTNGAAPSSITVNWGTAGALFGTPGATIIGKTDGLSQTSSPFKISNVQQNGSAGGLLTGVTISTDGYVTGSYSNGSTRNLYKIPLVKVTNPDKLDARSGNVFSLTDAAGSVSFIQPNQASGPSLESNTLESSNVDQSKQLTDLIIAQQAYQFNTKLVSTSDAMLQNLTQMGTT